MKLDITRCLTLSAGHITDETWEALKTEPKTDDLRLCVYEKSCEGGELFGFWIHLPESLKENYKHLPKDLMGCLMLALENDCEWLCLDSEAQSADCLPLYG